jgi:hypothetical protein
MNHVFHYLHSVLDFHVAVIFMSKLTKRQALGMKERKKEINIEVICF